LKIRVKVKPGSKSAGISREGAQLIVMVREPPREGRANQAVIKLVAAYFGVPQSQVRVLSGHKSRSKVIEIIGTA
jgi:hypothetical protein